MLNYDPRSTWRLSASSMFSLAVHGLLIFGFIKTTASFDPHKLIPHTLDVTLVTQPKSSHVEEALLKADQNSRGELSTDIQAPKQSAATPRDVISSQAKTRFVATPRYRNEAALADIHPQHKRRTISAATHAASDAAYLAWWRQRIESLGTKMYRQSHPSADFGGELRMLVTINRKGELLEVNIRRSSGNPRLDQLAIDIVKKAAPFKALPEAMQDTDVLEIIRTWRFYAPTGEFVSQ